MWIILARPIQRSVAGVNGSVDLKIAYFPFLIDFFSISEKFFPQRWVGLLGPGFNFVFAILPWDRVIEGSYAAGL